MGWNRARCQKHSTKPQALHLARILNPLTTALRFGLHGKQLKISVLVLAYFYLGSRIRAGQLHDGHE
jgi:hypothetical protein